MSQDIKGKVEDVPYGKRSHKKRTARERYKFQGAEIEMVSGSRGPTFRQHNPIHFIFFYA